jgi:putative membrane protein
MLEDLFSHLAMLGISLGVLAIGVCVYAAITPYPELRLVRQGNPAAGLTLAGTIIALALPISSVALLGSEPLAQAAWALIAILLQLIAYVAVSRLIRDLPARIEARDCAAAAVLSSLQIAVGLINAAALAS